MDEKILALLSAGDTEGVTLLQKQCGPMVQYIVRGILRDAQDTEECVSDVWLHVWERFETFDRAKGTLAAWMTVVARNVAVDRLRRRRAWSRCPTRRTRWGRGPRACGGGGG